MTVISLSSRARSDEVRTDREGGERSPECAGTGSGQPSALPRGLGPPHPVGCGALAGLRTRGRCPCLLGRMPTGRRFPDLLDPVRDDDGRSHSPLRGSPGLSPGSLLPRAIWMIARTSCGRHHTSCGHSRNRSLHVGRDAHVQDEGGRSPRYSGASKNSAGIRSASRTPASIRVESSSPRRSTLIRPVDSKTAQATSPW